MPPAPLWHRRIAEIRTILERWPAPILDRAAIEKIFGLRRRSAISLLALLDGYQVGKTFLVERATLLRRLEEIAGPKVERTAAQRKVQVSDHLAQMKAQARPRLIRVTPPEPAVNQRLPAGVTFEGRGRMVFAYQSAGQLLGQIYALATTAATDYGAFEETIATRTLGDQEEPVVQPGGTVHNETGRE